MAMQAKLCASVILGFLLLTPVGWAGEPGWERGVIRFGRERREIRNTHILHRPYRPLHVYGNAVRRLHYHGRILPAPSDFARVRR
jgi:hypothetical protein